MTMPAERRSAMTAPVRLRLSRAKGFDLQAHSRAVNGLPAINVARPSRWGNPWRAGDTVYVPSGRGVRARSEPMTAAEAVAKFRAAITPPFDPDLLTLLRGHNLACWCAPNAPCHADVLIELANRPFCEAVE